MDEGTIRRKLTSTLVCALSLALTAGVASETASAGNSANAQACQKGGWQLLKKADGGRFASQAECVSYGAQGGTLAPLAGIAACAAAEGTFGTGPNLMPALQGVEVVWVCNNMAAPTDTNDYLALQTACGADGGTVEQFTLGAPFHYACWEPSA